eukprot:COSAG06_NODE_75084_length_135_cov_19.805556_1_plen_44_part_11
MVDTKMRRSFFQPDVSKTHNQNETKREERKRQTDRQRQTGRQTD